MAAIPMKGENYFVAEVTVGRVGPDQAPPRKEFGVLPHLDVDSALPILFP
jgi:hypothetical protein